MIRLRNPLFLASLNRAGGTPTPPAASLVYDINGSTYVQFTGGGATANPTEYTIAAWLRPTASANACVVVRSGGDPASGWSHSIEQRTTGWRSYTYTGGGAVNCENAVAPTLNAWTHVVGTAKNSDFLRLYLNGLSAAAPVAMGSLWTGGNDWWACKGSGGAASNFTGQIAELTIWNKQLTDLEVYTLASGARGLSSSIQAANIIAYCQMNDAADGVTLIGNWGEYTGTLTQTRTGAPIGKNLDLPLRANALPTANMLANWKADAISANNDDALSSWVDSSGNGFTATQAGASKPVYKTNVINGLPAVRFDSQFFDVPAPFGASTAAEIYAVVKIDADPPASSNDTGLWTFGGGGSERMHFPWTDGTIYDDFCSSVRKTTSNPALSFTSWRLYAARSASGSWQNDVDGVNLYTTASNTFDSTVGLGNCIGRSKSGSVAEFFLKGYIAEIVLYGTTLTAAQKIQVHSYFKEKYALTIA